MTNNFIEVQFPIIVNLSPDKFHKGLYEELEYAVKKKYSGIAHAKIGYVKPDSVEIVSKHMGKYEGSHLTGNMSFHMIIRCLATMPLKDMTIDALVTLKNDAGLVCRNFKYPYSLFVPNIPGDADSETISRINTNDSVTVTVLDSRLKAPNIESKSDRAKPEYWVICKLSKINKEEINQVELPSVKDMPIIFKTVTTGMDKLIEDRMKFSGGMFENLQTVKHNIEEIRKDYLEYLKTTKNFIKDPIINSLTKGQEFVIGVVKGTSDKKASVQVVYAVGSYETRINETILFDFQDIHEEFNFESYIILINPVKSRVVKYFVLDMWLNHVKYIVNPNELIHTSKSYENQLKSSKFKVPIDDLPKYEKAISRAYYKIVEIMGVFKDKLFKQDSSSLNIACIAESPGGFIQAILDERKDFVDNITGVSISIGDDKPWTMFQKTYDRHYKQSVDLKIFDTEDKIIMESNSSSKSKKTKLSLYEGNLTSKDARDQYLHHIDGKLVDLVTADGGFGRDKTSSEMEEVEVSSLILAEVSIALKIQAKGGSFVLKIFDITTQFTVDVLNILSYCYENVNIIKPKMSRNASSEKYIVCTNFRFLRNEENENEELDDIVEKLESILYTPIKDGDFLYSVLSIPDPEIQATIVPYNNIFIKHQIDFIMQGREYSLKYIASNGSIEIMEPYVIEQYTRAHMFYKTFMKV